MSDYTTATQLSAEPPANPDLVIIGGGLAGLTAAALAARAGKTVVVHEKRNHVGGQARSTVKDGFTLNQGPHALYRDGHAERVLTDLGVALQGGQPPVKGRIVFDGQAHVAPAGPSTLLRTAALSPRDKAQVARQLALLPKLQPADFADQTVDEWIAQSVTRDRPAAMLHALVRLSTYANQPEKVSADVAISQLQSALADGVLYLHGGWQSIVDQLQALPGVHIVSGAGMETLPDAPAVIVAVGSPPATSALVGRDYDVGPAAAASCLDLGLRRSPEHSVVIGGDVPFYFSNHSAVANLAPPGHFHACALQYLSQDDEPDLEAIEAFARYAGVRDDDIVQRRRLHRMTTISALPTASRGGMAGRPGVTDTDHENVFIAGDWVGPDGHLADASVASAEAAASAAIRILDGRLQVAP